MFRFCTFVVAAFASLGIALSVACPFAQADQILSENWSSGSFATNGWQISNDVQAGDSANFFIDGNASTNLSGTPTLGPYNGNANYAYSDQSAAASNRSALYVPFKVPDGFSQIEVSFHLYATTSADGPIVNSDSLDLGNINARADILNAGAPVFSTAAGDVLSEIYSANLNGFNQTGWSSNSTFSPADQYVAFDQIISVAGGNSYTLRFAESNDSSVVTNSIGDASITTFGPGGVATPEPSTIVLMTLSGLGLGLACAYRHRQSTP